MKQVTCACVSVFKRNLTRGKKYAVLEFEPEKERIKVRGDNLRTRWFPTSCFDMTGSDVPVLCGTRILDEIEPLTGMAEVDVELSDGQVRWCFFVTPAHLAANGDWIEGTRVRLHYGAPHMIVVSELTEDIIHAALREIENQGELIDCTKPIE